MRKFCFLAALILNLSFSYSASCEETVSPLVSFNTSDIFKKIEARRGVWIGFKASLNLEFLIEGKLAASCKGSLTYHRLNEELLLLCSSDSEKLLFIFKTKDREFNLYLPTHKTLYQGNIFSLEDSPSIESHLRALDLYRALKPGLIPIDKTQVSQAAEGLISLEVTHAGGQMSRKLMVSNQGDIPSEIYYDLAGHPSLEIKRSDFKKILPSGLNPNSAFPNQVFIQFRKKTPEGETLLATRINFSTVNFTSDLNPEDFQYFLPEDTRTIVLEDPLEEDRLPVKPAPGTLDLE